jgi:Protein of unknown function (DUF3987)
MSEDSALRYLALLNRLWDGLAFRRDRTTAQSFVVQGRRLTCSLMMQEVVFTRLMAARGGAARGIGFLARFLLAWPMSTMGMRRYQDADLSALELAAFDQRMHELLDLPLPTDRPELTLCPEKLFMSQAARREWIAFHDDVEQELVAMEPMATSATSRPRRPRRRRGSPPFSMSSSTDRAARSRPMLCCRCADRGMAPS